MGKCADVLILNPTDLDLQPVYDPFFTDARCATGRDVETVVAGHIMMKDRLLLNVGEEKLKATIRERVPRIMQRFGALVP